MRVQPPAQAGADHEIGPMVAALAQRQVHLVARRLLEREVADVADDADDAAFRSRRH